MALQNPTGDLWARFALRLYRGLGSMFYPFTGPFLRARASRGKEDLARRKERYGYASVDRPEGPLVWVHAASVGESLAIMPLIERIDSFGINVVMTTGTVTSAAATHNRLPKRTVHQYVPMDMKRAARRFLDHWQPDLAIFAESELWPTIIQELAARNVPQILVNARMSDRSYRRWARRPALAEVIFGQLSQVVAQSEVDGDRFRDLGAPWITVVGNLKIDVGVPDGDPEATDALNEMIGDRPRWIAVSTHEGEEEMVMRVHDMLAAHVPDILTIIVPRHPERCGEIAEMIRDRGYYVVTRSSNEPIGIGTDIFLGNTIGEMGLYLRLAAIAFMGNSLGSEGGHNPVEPALTGTAILSGRYVQNFRDTYQSLLEAGGARLVRDEQMLAGHVLHLLRSEKDLAAMQRAARETVSGMTGALERSIQALDPYVMPLRVEAGLAKHTASPDSEQVQAR